MPAATLAQVSDHFAQFYEQEDVLLEAVAQFIGSALCTGGGGVIIATPEHRQGIQDRLAIAHIDMRAATEQGRFVALDAQATLARLLVDGVADRDRFFEVIGPVIDGVSSNSTVVRAFGEMVALLAGVGDHAGAVRLERLWNEIGQTRTFSLFCAYPLRQFRGHRLGGALDEVIATHRHVIPGESFTLLTAADARLREILVLQHKAHSLESEIARRESVEEQLRQALIAEQRARQEAEAALRLRDEFVSIASHELRTPLTTLSGYAQLVLRRFSRDGELDPARLRLALESITTQADKLSRLLGHLLDVSRLEEGKLRLERQPTDVVALVQQSVLLARGWSEDHSVGLMAPPSLEAEVDALRLEQVLTNLLDNAIKYSPSGGKVEVQLALRRGQVELSVRDYGLGVPVERRGQIFERFYQAHSPGYRSGLGLGLYICREIVELHGGSIRAEFPRGGGTRLVVRLPQRVAAPLTQLAAD